MTTTAEVRASAMYGVRELLGRRLCSARLLEWEGGLRKSYACGAFADHKKGEHQWFEWNRFQVMFFRAKKALGEW